MSEPTSEYDVDASVEDELAQRGATSSPVFKPLNVMTVEQVLSSARRVEGTAHICIRADLQGRFDDLVSQLAVLLDEDGNVRTAEGDEPALGDVSEAHRLQDEIEAVHAEMRANMWHVLFRAMPDDDWDKFEAKHRPGGPRAAVKDAKKWANEMIVACAIDPELSIEQVMGLRKELGNTQVTALASKAYEVNTVGGTDIPKSLPFSLSPRPQE